MVAGTRKMSEEYTTLVLYRVLEDIGDIVLQRVLLESEFVDVR